MLFREKAPVGMRHTEKLAPMGALTAALISITCCLPFSIPAALGLASIAVFASANQLWLIAASLVLLAFGIFQLIRKPACNRRSRTSIVLLCVSAVLVFAVVFLPQTIAGFLADHLP
jgi:hypothetical protein